MSLVSVAGGSLAKQRADATDRQAVMRFGGLFEHPVH